MHAPAIVQEGVGCVCRWDAWKTTKVRMKWGSGPHRPIEAIACNCSLIGNLSGPL